MNWKAIMNKLYWAKRMGDVDEPYVRKRVKIDDDEERIGMTARTIVQSTHYIISDRDMERVISRTSSILSWMKSKGWVRIIGRSQEDGRKNVYMLTKSGRKFAEIKGIPFKVY